MSLQELPLDFGNKSHSIKRLQESEQFLRAFGLDEGESSASSVSCVMYYECSSDEMLNELCHDAAGKISLHGRSAGCSFTAHKNTKFVRRMILFSSSVFERNIQIGAVIGDKLNFVNWW